MAVAVAVAGTDCPFPVLHRLNLSHNGIKDWSAVVANFGSWKALRHIMLNGNELDTTEHLGFSQSHQVASETTASGGGGGGGGGSGVHADADADAPPAVPFPSLQCISLSGNGIASWTSVDALNELPQLVALNFEGNPIGGGGLGPRQVRVR